jgi:hypothetical protein
VIRATGAPQNRSTTDRRECAGCGPLLPSPWIALLRVPVRAVAEAAAAPVIQKYTGVLGAADVFSVPAAFSILESIRLDLGYHMDVHP